MPLGTFAESISALLQSSSDFRIGSALERLKAETRKLPRFVLNFDIKIVYVVDTYMLRINKAVSFAI